jgi:nucleoside-diphosphate-sugar epimerase
VSESAQLLGDLGPYSVAKIEAERQLLAVRPDAVILRPGIVYGGGSPQWTQRIATLLRQHRLGDLGPLGDGYCNLVHVTDVARAVESGLKLGRGGCFNLSLREPPTWNQYFVRFGVALRYVPVARLGARRMKLETKLLAPPFKILEILAGRLRIRSKLLPPPIPGSLLRVCAQEIKLDTRAAERELGLAWLDLEAGLREAAAPYFLSSVGVAPI